MAEPTTEQLGRATVKAIEMFKTTLEAIDPKDRSTVMQMMATIGVCALRAAEGDEFVRGFLEAALRDLDCPGETMVMASRH